MIHLILENLSAYIAGSEKESKSGCLSYPLTATRKCGAMMQRYLGMSIYRKKALLE
jgi:hypothetical protein